MPAITLHEASFVYLEKATVALIGILKKGAESPAAASLPTVSLYEDMKPLAFQVNVVARMAERLTKEVTGAEETCSAGETTMAELIATAEKTLALLKSVDPAAVNGKEDQPVKLFLPNAGTWNMTVQTFSTNFVVPNTFFHVQTAYAILRMKGVPLGKPDYMGPFSGPPNSPP